MMRRSRRRILIIEDDVDSRDGLRFILESAGHEVYEAEDGVGGVAAALSVEPDVALIDVGLPGLDGYAVAQRIRAQSPGKAMMLVALTGYGSAEDRDRALSAGFDTHLLKPVDPDALNKLLSQ
jgi:CheY-like chemotaxis protein